MRLRRTRRSPPATSTVSASRSRGGTWTRGVRACGLLSGGRSFTGVAPVRAIAVLRRRDLPRVSSASRLASGDPVPTTSWPAVSSAFAFACERTLPSSSDDTNCARKLVTPLGRADGRPALLFRRGIVPASPHGLPCRPAPSCSLALSLVTLPARARVRMGRTAYLERSSSQRSGPLLI